MTNGVSRWRVCARKSRYRQALALLALGVAMSCGRLPRTNYYALRFPAPAPANDSKTNFVLGVEHFREELHLAERPGRHFGKQRRWI